MTSSSSQDAEILVHITAPSRAADDAVYRQLAQAYLAFEPQTRINLPLAEASSDAQAQPVQQQVTYPTSSSIGGGFAVTSFDQTFEIGSQDLSFEGVLDNRSSPCIRQQQVTTGVAASSGAEFEESFSSWFAPPSQISDSYPMPDAGLFDTSPSRVLQHFIGRGKLPHDSPVLSSPTAQRQASVVPVQMTIGVNSSAPTTSQDESTQSLPVETPGYVRINKVIPLTPQGPKTIAIASSESVESTTTDQPGADVTHISNSIVSEKSPVVSPRAGSEPPYTKRPEITGVQQPDLVRSSSDTGPILSSLNPILNQLNDSLEIRPPSPPVGIKDIGPSDLVSEKLDKLGSDLSSRYKATSKRPIDSFERGYWLLDCAAWSQDARSNAWVFLNNYLRSGLAGWGTWCRRGESHEWIRLYCFGHVVKHTYLLLYLASGRQLKMTGASWFDAAGEMVLEVSPHEKQP